MVLTKVLGRYEGPLWVNRDGGEPVAGPAMSVVTPKAVVESGEWRLPRWTFAS